MVDCTAGAESFASGMFTRFDLTFLVAEPTRKGVGVYRQWSEYADGYDVALAVVGNKVQYEQDEAFLREHIGADLLTCFAHEPSVRAMEQGRPFGLADLGTGAGRPCRCCRMRWTRRSRTGPRSPARRWNSTSGTPAPGRTRRPGRIWPFRSTLASP